MDACFRDFGGLPEIANFPLQLPLQLTAFWLRAWGGTSGGLFSGVFRGLPKIDNFPSQQFLQNTMYTVQSASDGLLESIVSTSSSRASTAYTAQSASDGLLESIVSTSFG